VNPKNLADHLRKNHYGNFVLTDAIRPSLFRQVVPKQGYRVEKYKDPKAGFSVPVLAGAVSREHLFDLFLELIDPLGEMVDVVLETSHDSDDNRHVDYYREQIDLPVLKSHCCDFEDLLINDGCTGLAVLSCEEPIEVQFDEHKLLVVYAADLEPFMEAFENFGIQRDDSLKLISEGEHLHSTDPRFRGEFEQLAYRLGVGEAVERLVS